MPSCAALLAPRGWAQAEVIRPCLCCRGLTSGEVRVSWDLSGRRGLLVQVRRGLPGASGVGAHPALCSIYC